MATPSAVVSRRGVDRIRAGHPWIFRTDVVDVAAEPGDLVRVTTERGRPLGWATFSSASQITLRLVSQEIGALPELRTWLSDRIVAAAAYRDTLAIDGTAWRVVHGESDGLPATIVDRYGSDDGVYFVVQTLSQAAERWLPLIGEILVERFGPRGVVVRNDPKVRRLEGLEEHVGVLYGDVPAHVAVREGRIAYRVDLRGGQKTGLFLDQRENHRMAAGYARGDVLDAFTYNGGFALQMAGNAERVLALDSSAAAVETTRDNARANGLTNVEVREANVFDELRELEVSDARFDTIALDPPAFAKNKASVERALAGYKEINLRALRLLRPGGHLVTCSCSYNVDEPLFVSVLQQAAADARVSAWIVEKRAQARDHPWLLTVPETHYLKCVVLRRV
ncbi:MAG TPA: class I SAM-dependent rRNA methyltransferase [Vicinamibacterales bacterium]|jgi:23S rRNA (cytosine1962-C5)-methyltransferase|nr:class I SAM-dependent rRNA methyltransferase [Vicinamibacterales bacterium]